MDFKWIHIGSLAEQERRMCEAVFLGPHALEIVEAGWIVNQAGNDPEDLVPIWDMLVYQWDPSDMKYVKIYESRFQYSERELAKQAIQDWYGANIKFEEFVWDKSGVEGGQ